MCIQEDNSIKDTILWAIEYWIEDSSHLSAAGDHTVRIKLTSSQKCGRRIEKLKITSKGVSSSLVVSYLHNRE